MLGRTALFAIVALAWAGAAQAQECPPPPPIEPAIEAPTAMPATHAGRSAAMKAEKAWATPRLKYGACRRAEISALGVRVNALAAQINAIVDDAMPLDKKLSAARAVRDKAFEAYAKRRKVKAADLPIAAHVAPEPLAQPCPAAPSVSAAPEFPDGETANAGQMRRADQMLQNWAAPIEAYLQCRKAERQPLAASYEAVKAQYDGAQADYVKYRTAFNDAVAKFEAGLAVYTANIPNTP